MARDNALRRGIEDLDWSLCHTFIVVARCGAIAGAVEELGQSHPTIRRQLERLEQVVGARLFSRSQSGVIPTPLALRLLPHVERMQAAASQMLRSAACEELVGVVRVAVHPLIAADLLPPIFHRVRGAHSGLNFELEVSDVLVDLLRRDADVALSVVRPVQDGLVASRIGAVRLGLFCSRGWLAANGIPETLDSLVSGRSLLGGKWTALTTRLSKAVPAATFVMTSSDQPATLAAAEAGLGVAALPVFHARSRPGLVQVLPEVIYDLDLWLSVHPDLRHAPEVRVLIDGMRSVLSRPPHNGGGYDGQRCEGS